MKSLGTKIGKGCIINTSVVTDWDLITIQDDVMINRLAKITAHMLSGGVTGRYLNKYTGIGKGSVLESNVNLLAGARIDEFTHIYAGHQTIFSYVRGDIEKEESS